MSNVYVYVMHVLIQQIAMFQKEENFQFLFCLFQGRNKSKDLYYFHQMTSGFFPEKILFCQKMILLTLILLTWRTW